MDVRYITINEEDLEDLPIVDGQIIALADTPRWYYDMNDIRYNSSGIEYCSSLPSVDDALNGVIYILDRDEDSSGEDPEGRLNGAYLFLDGEFIKISQLYNPASETELGLVKVGTNIDVTPGGVISIPSSRIKAIAGIASTASTGLVRIGQGVDVTTSGVISVNTTQITEDVLEEIKSDPTVFPRASKEEVGVVQVGENIEVSEEGLISLTGQNVVDALGYTPNQQLSTTTVGSPNHPVYFTDEGLPSTTSYYLDIWTYGNGKATSYATAEGNMTTASGQGAHSEGNKSIASGVYSHAQGNQTLASGLYSDAAGYMSTASGTSAIAQGDRAKATADSSIAIGSYVHAAGESSVVIGSNAYASTSGCMVFGNNSTASTPGQVIIGSYGNVAPSESSSDNTVYRSSNKKESYEIESSVMSEVQWVYGTKDATTYSSATTQQTYNLVSNKLPYFLTGLDARSYDEWINRYQYTLYPVSSLTSDQEVTKIARWVISNTGYQSDTIKYTFSYPSNTKAGNSLAPIVPASALKYTDIDKIQKYGLHYPVIMNSGVSVGGNVFPWTSIFTRVATAQDGVYSSPYVKYASTLVSGLLATDVQPIATYISRDNTDTHVVSLPDTYGSIVISVSAVSRGTSAAAGVSGVTGIQIFYAWPSSFENATQKYWGCDWFELGKGRQGTTANHYGKFVWGQLLAKTATSFHFQPGQFMFSSNTASKYNPTTYAITERYSVTLAIYSLPYQPAEFKDMLQNKYKPKYASLSSFQQGSGPRADQHEYEYAHDGMSYAGGSSNFDEGAGQPIGTGDNNHIQEIGN